MEETNKGNSETSANQGNLDQNSQQDSPQQEQGGQKMSKEMEIGFHNGALTTLNKERGEIVKMAQNIDSLMKMHVQRLKELGVKVHFKGQSQENQGQKNSQE